MKKIFIYITVLLICGCNSLQPISTVKTQNPPSQNISDDKCPKQPPNEESKPESITLTNSILTKSGRLKVGEGKVYKFEGKSGKMFHIKHGKEICSWVISPKGDLVDLDNNLALPMNGNYLVLLSLSIPEGMSTFNLEMSLKDKPKPTPPPIPEVKSTKPPPQPTPPPAPEVKSTKPPPQLRQNLTEAEALDLVKGWYSSKGRIFGYPFDRSLVSKYATGKLYYDTLQKDGGGSVGWLKRNNCYYTYDFSNIEKVISFNNSGDKPSLRIRVHEQLQLHGSRSAGCGKGKSSYRKNVTYWFEKDSGTWKIVNYVVE